MHNKHFLLYADAGASADCIGQWKEFLDSQEVSYGLCMASDIIHGALAKADCLIMPGGADLPYCDKLNGVGNMNIKSFVENGGIYFGICAGVYYAHRRIEWTNTTECILGDRELAFFDSVAIGPLVKPYNPKTSAGMAFVIAHFQGKEAIVYYKGGPLIVPDSETEIIATFTHENIVYPAIVRKSVGHGLVIGMSPHMEYSSSYLATINAPECPNRMVMFTNIMTMIFDKPTA